MVRVRILNQASCGCWFSCSWAIFFRFLSFHPYTKLQALSILPQISKPGKNGIEISWESFQKIGYWDSEKPAIQSKPGSKEKWNVTFRQDISEYLVKLANLSGLSENDFLCFSLVISGNANRNFWSNGKRPTLLLVILLIYFQFILYLHINLLQFLFVQ